MKEIVAVLETANGTKAERIAAQAAFLEKRGEIWNDIQEGRFPATYVSAGRKKFVGAPRRTAIRCDFLLASKIALGPQYHKDRIADQAQRDLLFYVLRDRETFPKAHGQEVLLLPEVHGETSRVRHAQGLSVHR